MDYKTALPPGRRAKTDEEKEQRRIERILRNRRAAQASRDKKRKYVEYLESYIEKLNTNLLNYKYNQEYLLSKVDGQDKAEVESNLKLIDLESLEPELRFNVKSEKKYDNVDSGHEDHGAEQLVSPPVSDVEHVSTKPTSNSSVEHEYNLDQNESAMSSNSSSIGGDQRIDGMFDNSRSNSLFSDDQLTNPNDSIESDSSFDSNLLLNPIDNYLSPVSINSPVNSPINLSLYDSNLNDLEHNSEVVVDYKYFTDKSYFDHQTHKNITGY